MPRWTSDLELRSLCRQTENQINTCGAVVRYAAGKHEIEIWSTIVGEGEQPHATLTVDLACDSTPVADAGAPCMPEVRDDPPPAPAQDALVTGQDTNALSANASDDELAAEDERAPEDARALDTVSAHGATNGCALASDGSGAPALLGLGSVVALITRRRRRAR